MRRYYSVYNSTDVAIRCGPAPIAAGLAILTASLLCPGLPVVTGMALVALGATQVTLARFRGTAAIVPVTFLHLATYGGLYALFVGATMHAASCRVGTAHQSVARMTGGHCPPYALALIDVALSIVPLGLALQCAWCQLHDDQPAV